MDTAKILSQMVRIGTVTATDAAKRTARVKFQDTGMTSGWLYVLASPPEVSHPKPPSPEPPNEESGDDPSADDSDHTVTPWMPKVNAIVLTVYLPIPNADGFVLGEIGA